MREGRGKRTGQAMDYPTNQPLAGWLGATSHWLGGSEQPATGWVARSNQPLAGWLGAISHWFGE